MIFSIIDAGILAAVDRQHMLYGGSSRMIVRLRRRPVAVPVLAGSGQPRPGTPCVRWSPAWNAVTHRTFTGHDDKS